MNAFSAYLAEVGPEARRARLVAAAPALEEEFARTDRYAQRLAAARLEDARLEDQRATAAAALEDVIDSMSLVVSAAQAGSPVDAEQAVTEFTVAVGELRGLPADP
ncbi:MAG: hypothetical protein AB7V62_04805 [Thermoleophilia bacterium]